MSGTLERRAAMPARCRRALPAETRVAPAPILILALFLASAAASPDPSGAGSPRTPEGVTAPAAGMRHRSVLEHVAGLEKPVTYSETKIPLSALVQKVVADTGVPLTAAPEVADEPVAVVVKAMPARELLAQVVDLLDYQWRVQAFRRSGVQDRHGRSTSTTRTPERLNAIYEIYQDLASRQREAALRQARVGEIVQRLQKQVQTYTEVASLTPEEFQRVAEAGNASWPEWWKLSPEEQAARLQDPGTKELQQRYVVARALQAPIPRALATLLGLVAPAQWAPLMQGEGITWSSDPKPGEERLPLEVERRLRGATPTWLPAGAHLALPQPGEEERMRQQDQALQEAWAAASGYRVTLRVDAKHLETEGHLTLFINAAPFRNGAPNQEVPAAELPPATFSGTSLTIFSGGRSALPPPEENTAERRAVLEKDPVLGTKREFKTAVKSKPNTNGMIVPAWWSLWDLLPDLARTYGVNFIADSYWSSAPGVGLTTLPHEPAPLYALLDRAAASTDWWDRAPTKVGHGALIRLRSRTWFLDRPREIPLRYVRRWKAIIAQRGALPLETYLEIAATLTDDQSESLSGLIDTAGLPRDLYGADMCRNMLRLYASLLPGQQETLQRGGILPVSRMTPRQQSLLVATLKRFERMMPPEETTPEQLAHVGLTLKRVPMIRTIDGSKGNEGVSDEPAAAASQLLGPAVAPGTVVRIPVTQVQFVLTHGEEQRGGVGIVVAASP